MIAQLHGVLAEKYTDNIILNVNGVGYKVICPTNVIDSLNLNENCSLSTYHHIREQSQELFGFTESSAKELFEKLITVNGIGPKAGLAIMNLGNDSDIRSAIASGDVAYINAASGVGKKGAEKVVLELKDKVGGEIRLTGSTPSAQVVKDDALDALVSLGYSQNQASQALSKIDQSLSVEEKIKLALKEI